MAKQLPFDVFVARKIAKWEARAQEWNVPLVDAIESGEFDFFAIGRASLGDPEWAKKVQRGEWDQIIPFSSRCLKSLE